MCLTTSGPLVFNNFRTPEKVSHNLRPLFLTNSEPLPLVSNNFRPPEKVSKNFNPRQFDQFQILMVSLK